MSNDAVVNQTLFDKYKVIKKLNNGSFGVVYLGQNVKTNDFIAIKMVNRLKKFFLGIQKRKSQFTGNRSVSSYLSKSRWHTKYFLLRQQYHSQHLSN